SFPPLILFQVWVRPDNDLKSLFIMLALMFVFCALVIVIAYRWDKPGYFDWAIAGYFFSGMVMAICWPGNAAKLIHHYAATGIYACLFMAAFFPPLLGMEPFTFHFAKKTTPPGTWGNPVFIKVNRIMTFAWAGLFAVGIILSLHPSLMMRTVIPNMLFLCVGFPFNHFFPDFYLKRTGLPTRAELRQMDTTDPWTIFNNLPDIPLPTSAVESIRRMPDLFNADAAGELSAVIGFDISGSETFHAYLHIHGGICILEGQPADKPDLMIHAPASIWLGIARRDIDGREAFMNRAYTADGNLGLLMSINKIFSGNNSCGKKVKNESIGP
ncbi:MAG: SCP2 sterol-binding domain-containing protein, partial [Syntrophales bacterium]|nr:SCP2 sterol-binding domain-containing protein [Syntrophales bacterium]